MGTDVPLCMDCKIDREEERMAQDRKTATYLAAVELADIVVIVRGGVATDVGVRPGGTLNDDTIAEVVDYDNLGDRDTYGDGTAEAVEARLAQLTDAGRLRWVY